MCSAAVLILSTLSMLLSYDMIPENDRQDKLTEAINLYSDAVDSYLAGNRSLAERKLLDAKKQFSAMKQTRTEIYSELLQLEAALARELRNDRQKEEDLLLQAHAIRKDVLGLPKSKYSDLCCLLADSYYERGRFVRARALLDEMFDYFVREGDNDSQVIKFAYRLGLLHLDCEEYQSAEKMLTIALGSRSGGATYMSYPGVLCAMVRLMLASKQKEKAKGLDEEIAKILERAESLPDQSVRLLYRGHGLYLGSIGQHASAERMLKAAKDLSVKQWGATHEATVESDMALVELYHSMQRNEDAERLVKRCVASREKTLGPTHPILAKTYLTYSRVLLRVNQEALAGRIAREARRMLEEHEKSEARDREEIQKTSR